MHSILVVWRISARVWRSAVIAAIVFGIFAGANECATGLALDARVADHELAGDVHSSHDLHSAAQSGGPIHGETTMDGMDHDHDAGQSPDVPGGSGSDNTGSSHAGHTHPGMGCLVSVDFAIPDLSVRFAEGSVGLPTVGSPASCQVRPEPPVPKFS